MPTVPTTFVPQVAPQGGGDIGQFQAPGIAPAENLAARQTAEFGRTMTAAGMSAFRAASAIVDDIDEATTKRADVQTLQGFSQVDGEFRALTGKAAEDSYAAAIGKMEQVAAAGMDGLQNDTQRRMFEPIVARNMQTFRQRMTEHRNQQAKVYATNEAGARAEQYADLAITEWRSRNAVDEEGYPVGAFNANMAVALNEVRTAGKLMGFADDSAQMRQMEQKVYDRVAIGVVNNMLAAKQYGDADEFLDGQTEMKRIDPKTADSLRSSLEANRQRTTVEELTESIKERGIIRAESNLETYSQEAGKDTMPPDTLREALERAEQIADPDMRRLVQNNLKTEFAQDEALAKQEYGILIENVEQFLAVPGNSIGMLPADQFGRLKPVDQDRFLKGQRQQDELGTMEELARNPSILTQDWLERNRTRMTHGTYLKLLADLNQPAKIQAASLDADMLDAVLVRNGFGELANPGNDTTAKERSLLFRDNVKTMIDEEQRRVGRTLSREEKRDVMEQALIQRASISKWGFDTKGIPVETMTPAQLQKAYVTIKDDEVFFGSIPDADRRSIGRELRAVGLDPTMENVVKAWMQLKGMR